MANRTSLKGMSLLSVAVIVLCEMTAMAQNPTDKCRSTQVIPLPDGSEPPAKIVIDPPLPGPLASRGVAVIQYCAQNLHLALIELEDAKHHTLDRGTVTFGVPEKSADEKHH